MTDADYSLHAVAHEVRTCLDDLQAVATLGPGRLLVVGASSSEVMGRHIGTATSLAVGRIIVAAILEFAAFVDCDVAFQCCEHLNRALVVTRRVAQARGYREVTAIPVPGAGGAVAASAYAVFPDPCLVDTVIADAGLDIGDTLIGMHIRRIAVPVRGRLKQIGQAHVTMAKSRPPLIGGARAVYDVDVARARLGDTAGEEDG